MSVHTVNTHREAIVDKLGVVGAQLVRYATIHNQTRHPSLVADRQVVQGRSTPPSSSAGQAARSSGVLKWV